MQENRNQGVAFEAEEFSLDYQKQDAVVEWVAIAVLGRPNAELPVDLPAVEQSSICRRIKRNYNPRHLHCYLIYRKQNPEAPALDFSLTPGSGEFQQQTLLM